VAEVTAAEPVDERSAGREPSLPIAMAFLERISELPATVWVDVARRMLRPPVRLTDHSGARQGLLSALWDRRLACLAWRVRDAAETAAYLARRNGRAMTSDERPSFEFTSAAATDAALALLIRDHLSPADFAALYAPFDHAVPLASLIPLD
jgi:hypothetical protein